MNFVSISVHKMDIGLRLSKKFSSISIALGKISNLNSCLKLSARYRTSATDIWHQEKIR